MQSFCGKCGAPLSGNTRFCGACGAPVTSVESNVAQQVPPVNTVTPQAYAPTSNASAEYAQPPVTPPAGKKNLLPLIIIGAVAAVAIIVMAIINAIFNTPTALIGKSLMNTAAAIEKSDLVSSFNKVQNGGSLQLTGDLEKMMQDYGVSIPASIDLKAYSNVEKERSAVECNLQYDGRNVGGVSLFTTKEDLAVSSTLLSQAYGIHLPDANTNFSNSIFSCVSPSHYALSDYAFDNCMQMLKSYDTYYGLAEETKKVGADYTAWLVQQICTEGSPKKSSETVTVGTKNIKTTDVTVSLDGPALSNIIDEFSSRAQDDDQLRDLVKNYITILATSNSYRFGYLGGSTDEIFDQLDSQCKQISDALSDEDITVDLTFYVGKSGKTLVALDAKVNINDNKATINLVLGKNPVTSEEVSLKLRSEYAKMGISYEVSENTKKNYNAKFRVSNNSEDSLKVQINWDKKNSDLSLAMTTGYQEFSAEGQMTSKGGTTVINVDRLIASGETLKPSVALTICEKDTMPSVPEYEEILTLSEAQMDDLMEELQNSGSDLYNDYSDVLSDLNI